MSNHESISSAANASPYLLSTEQAARYLGVSRSFLERDRWRGQTIPFVRFNRTVRYERGALDDFVARHRCAVVED